MLKTSLAPEGHCTIIVLSVKHLQHDRSTYIKPYEDKYHKYIQIHASI